MALSKAKQQERDEAIRQLREAFPPGSTAHTILRHVAPSGMTRWISVVGIGSDGSVCDYTWQVARAMSENYGGSSRHEGIRVGGCGMDMGFHLVYSLSRTLYPEGFDCTQYGPRGGDKAGNDRSKWCPSNDHSNPPYPRVKMRHRDGGYAVNHNWL